LDFTRPIGLEFSPPDPERFPAIALGLEVARSGGTSGAVVNAANEAAVEAFLAGAMPFLKIVPACREILRHHDFDPDPNLDELLRLDRWARQELHRWICA
jgi:1-deoxy-D-xylulose-5-phosphate reductoisomerase